MLYVWCGKVQTRSHHPAYRVIYAGVADRKVRKSAELCDKVQEILESESEAGLGMVRLG